MRAGLNGPEFSLTLDGYDHTFNTWEPKLNVLDSSLVRSYMANQAITINIEHTLDELRELIYVRMAKMKSAEAEVEVSVPTAAFGAVAHALLDVFSRVPSQACKRPLALQTKVRSGRVKTWLEISAPAAGDVGAAASGANGAVGRRRLARLRAQARARRWSAREREDGEARALISSYIIHQSRGAPLLCVVTYSLHRICHYKI
jgi:hypothetical protein